MGPLSHGRRLAWVLAAALIALQLGVTAFWKDGIQETKMTETSLLNVSRFGDWQNHSFLPVTGRLGNEIAWSRPTVDERHQRPPLHLAFHGERLLVHYPTILESKLAATGATRWQKPISASFEFQVDTAGISTMSPAGRYTLLDFDGEPELTWILPLLTEQARLVYNEREKDELRYLFSAEPTPVSSPGMESDPMAMVYHRFAPLSNDLRWLFNEEDALLTAMRGEADDLVYLVGSRGIWWFPPGANSREEADSLIAEEIEAAALDFEEDLLVVLREEGDRYLRRLARDGSLRWEVPLSEEELGAQPPASAPGGHTYLMLGQKLLHFDNGRLEWSFPIPGTAGEPALYTVLEDRSILLAAGKILIQLGPNGVEWQRVETDHPLTTRPLMDPLGRVYVGAGPWIRCYR
ncbi:MAG: hypothetical protein PVJ76_14425 [Gemmatimonadota bacterium]|jgi:hypothetical protein